MIDWERVKKFRKDGCPRCGAEVGGSRGVQWHGLSWWCLGCGASANWERETEKR